MVRDPSQTDRQIVAALNQRGVTTCEKTCGKSRKTRGKWYYFQNGNPNV
jgi:hypothetical protein